eukprot:TRINITY_DN1549_c0_g1_i1.p1 TRINITY_DN1549_c0_g1~~TRINITY_DN1549_c0_g1_i1.p1  ORF type:complete len:110 (+),score=23.96 TRINITY_DN1549_c0_g1_i1:252-581(+)
MKKRLNRRSQKLAKNPPNKRLKKKAKRAARKQRAKERKKQLAEKELKIKVQMMIQENAEEKKQKRNEVVEIEYRSDSRVDETDPELQMYLEVFKKFHTAEELTTKKTNH